VSAGGVAPPVAHHQPAFATLIGLLMTGQTLGTMATMMLPAVAPKVAETYGVQSSLIGYQVSTLAAAMLISLVFLGNVSVRWGSCRATQISLSLMVVGCIAAILPHVYFLFLAALAMGLGYGMMTPSASHLLMRFTPAKRRNLIFSLKQTGVPMGGVGAALITPLVAVSVGWQWALAGNAVLLLILVALLQIGRPAWDDDRNPQARLITNPSSGIATIWNNPALRLLTWSGACFVIAQVCITTFTVVFFAEELKLGVVQAGLILAASQVGGVAGRVFWGWLADLTRRCYSVLSVLGGVMMCSALLCMVITPAWSLAASCALFFVFGSTASGWNGAFLAEVARCAPRQSISGATAGSLLFVNIGKMSGPLAFSAAYALSHSYALTFALLAVPAAAGMVFLLFARGAASVPAGKSSTA